VNSCNDLEKQLNQVHLEEDHLEREREREIEIEIDRERVNI